MRANRLMAVAMLSVLGVSGLTACGSDGSKSKDAAAPSAAASASASASPAASKSAAGGGLEALPVADILKKSQAAGAKLSAVKVTFKLDSDGEQMSGTVATDGTGNCTGSVAIGGKGKADVVRTGGKVWIKPDTQFVNAVAPGAGGVISGKWLSLGAGQGAEFTEFCDLGLNVQKNVGLDDNGKPEPGGTKGAVKQVGGVSAVTIKMTDPDGTATEAAIANEGEPYLLSLDAGAQGGMQFSDFGKPVKAVQPAAAEVIDGSKYLG
ncbi:hypothetical protein [Streptomyces sp. TLI_171]|uniref:hypothetical protein n=1 Tax=Streptomyces sp. TLI_171 TaxID=1938859 RepID=UPI000C188A0B|nr:hypothetical protein [Streptomyces sp. TLI_171]RKE19425.1 hypothetical protein BX266_2747 [Streptomyces sp. TLI_171]